VIKEQTAQDFLADYRLQVMTLEIAVFSLKGNLEAQAILQDEINRLSKVIERFEAYQRAMADLSNKVREMVNLAFPEDTKALIREYQLPSTVCFTHWAVSKPAT